MGSVDEVLQVSEAGEKEQGHQEENGHNGKHEIGEGRWSESFQWDHWLLN